METRFVSWKELSTFCSDLLEGLKEADRRFPYIRAGIEISMSDKYTVESLQKDLQKHIIGNRKVSKKLGIVSGEDIYSKELGYYITQDTYMNIIQALLDLRVFTKIMTTEDILLTFEDNIGFALIEKAKKK